MSKKSFKILLVLVTVLSLISSYSFATDTSTETTGADADSAQVLTTTSDDPTATSETPEEATTETSDEESASESEETDASINHDVYLSGDEVKIEAEETINGNAFIAGKSVTITGQIGGDLFVFADTLNLDGGQVYGNVFACADTITLNGLVYDLYGACKTLNISYDCVVYRDIKVICDDASINGVIGKDVNLTAGKSFSLEDDCVIYGSLNYSAPSEITVKEDLVKGGANYMGVQMIPNLSSIINDLKANSQEKGIMDYIFTALVVLVFVLVVWFVTSKFAPTFHEKINSVTGKQMLWALLVGFIALIVVPIISILLMLTVVGSLVGLLLLTLYFVALTLAPAIISIALAKLLANGVPALAKFNNVFAVIIVALLIWACGLIPYVGPFVDLAVAILGFGILIKLLFSGKAKKEKAEKPVETSEEKSE